MPMRQLRSCDFCGGDAAGVYEVLPPELSPTEAEQHRVVLCADCVETLEAAVNPLLERLGVDTDEGTEATPRGSSPSNAPDRPSPTKPPARAGRDREPTAESETPPETDPVAGAGASDTRGSGSPSDAHASAADPTSPGDDEPAPSSEHTPADSDESNSSDPDESGPSGESAAPVETGPPSPADDEPSPSTGDGADDGPVEWGAAGPASTDDAPDESVSDPVRNGIPRIDPSNGADSESETAATPPETGQPDGADDADATDTETRDPGAPDDEPEEFRTVMRLLGNREFPVERDAIVELAASAYELDDAHVDQCLDYAVDRGVIDDDGGVRYRG